MNVKEGGERGAVDSDGVGSLSYHKQRRGGELVSWVRERKTTSNFSPISLPYSFYYTLYTHT